MNKFQYKEKDYAEEILNNGFTSKYIASELKILSKYYKSEGKNEEEIKELLTLFCKTNLKGYREAVHFKMINSAVKFGFNERNKLIQIDNVDVTNKELEAIENMDIPHEYKRVVFSILVLNKLNRKFFEIRDGENKNTEFYFGGHKNYRELVSVSKIVFDKKKRSKVKNIHDLIHVLDEKEIVKITGNGNIKLLFMYDIEEDNNIVFSVDDYEVIGYFYDFHYGENRVKKCENKSCDVLIKANSNRHSYCKKCWDEIRSEQNRLKSLKYYHKNKDFTI